MPLKAINLTTPYPCILGTIGPAKEEWGEVILQFVNDYWKDKAVYHHTMPPRIKFEVSDDKSYPHFHIGLMFTERQKYAMFVRKLQQFMKQFAKDKPKGYDQDKEFSIRLFAVPCTEQVNQNILRGADLINHYLDNPTKEKSTDGKNFQVELTGFNISRFISTLADPEVASKYAIKYKKSKLELPPLDEKYGPLMLANRPNLEGVAQRWRYSRLNPANSNQV